MPSLDNYLKLKYFRTFTLLKVSELHWKLPENTVHYVSVRRRNSLISKFDNCFLTNLGVELYDIFLKER